MSEHKIALEWRRDTEDFQYASYTRDHTIIYGNDARICASAAPEYKGNADCFNPEEAFVTSLASCHMLTFLALACKKRFVVDSYRDDAVGVLGKNPEGKPAVTKVVLKPVVTFSGENVPGDDDFAQLHDKAHDMCFIANAVASCVEVVVEPVMKHSE
ncbi:MAG: OsmC family peroxiredoxin [Chitinivibrionales bacterium]|nr:OsmC family peroxiredoxin [Chitinivibrionales bacterium]MBD3394079.1 OsmC family peroxiredoxin [Chitinivibrionales bacterium]